MKVQAHNNELRPLFKENFDKVYDAIVKILPAEEVIFAKRDAGFGNQIQWSLPDDAQWQSLTQADTLDRHAVIDVFMRHKAVGESRLGKNKKLIEAIYSVPSEAHVYYAIDSDSRYRVMLTAWGYTFPYQAPETLLTHMSGQDMQDVTVKFIDNGQPAAGLNFSIYRQNRRDVCHTADAEGKFNFGSLPVGTTLQLKAPSAGRDFTLAVAKDRNLYTFDITPEPAAKPEPTTPPPMPEPVEVTAHPEPEPEPPVEMVFPQRQRDISIRMIDSSTGQPVKGSEVVVSAVGRPAVSSYPDEQGYIYLDNDDFTPGSTVKVEVPGQTAYPPFDLHLEPAETQYEVIFGQTSEPRWKEVLLAIAAATIAAGSLYLLLHFGFGLV